MKSKHIFMVKNVSPENIVVCAMWENTVRPDRPQQLTIWRKRIACWITKTTNTNSEYVMLTALSLQKRMHEYVSILGYTYIAACLGKCVDVFGFTNDTIKLVILL